MELEQDYHSCCPALTCAGAMLMSIPRAPWSKNFMIPREIEVSVDVIDPLRCRDIPTVGASCRGIFINPNSGTRARMWICSWGNITSSQRMCLEHKKKETRDIPRFRPPNVGKSPTSNLALFLYMWRILGLQCRGTRELGELGESW